MGSGIGFIRHGYTDTSMLRLSPAYWTLLLCRKGSCHRLFVLLAFRSTSMWLVWWKLASATYHGVQRIALAGALELWRLYMDVKLFNWFSFSSLPRFFSLVLNLSKTLVLHRVWISELVVCIWEPVVCFLYRIFRPNGESRVHFVHSYGHVMLLKQWRHSWFLNEGQIQGAGLQQEGISA